MAETISSVLSRRVFLQIASKSAALLFTVACYVSSQVNAFPERIFETRRLTGLSSLPSCSNQLPSRRRYQSSDCFHKSSYQQSQIYLAISDRQIILQDLDHDRKLVVQQLGYLPDNYVGVSAWTAEGEPLAIQTYPFEGGAPRRKARAAMGMKKKHTKFENSDYEDQRIGTPFPTLYWLTHPLISQAIAELERNGQVTQIQNDLSERERLHLWIAHQQYATSRWKSVSPTDRKLLKDLELTSRSIVRMREMIQFSGVAGTSMAHIMPEKNENEPRVPSVKCLHSHYAHFRSSPDSTTEAGPYDLEASLVLNPVGQRVHKLLQASFPQLIL